MPRRYRSGKTVAWSELSEGLNTQITRDKVAHHGVLIPRCCPCAITPHSTKLFSHGNATLDKKATAVLDRYRCTIYGSLGHDEIRGSVIWTEMTRNGYRFNLEGWSLSRVTMVLFGSRSTVGATSI
eukprot:scaffold8077_cov53-Attheya_sp.AAC.2